MIPELRDFLVREKAPFDVIELRDAIAVSHPATACRTAGRLAKVVILREGDAYALAVFPAAAAFDLEGFRRRVRRYALVLAKEGEFREQFPEFGVGPLPPFGRMSGIPVYLDRAFAEEDAIVFESGPHHEVVTMPMDEYVRVERPAIAPLGRALRAA